MTSVAQPPAPILAASARPLSPFQLGLAGAAAAALVLGVTLSLSGGGPLLGVLLLAALAVQIAVHLGVAPWRGSELPLTASLGAGAALTLFGLIRALWSEAPPPASAAALVALAGWAAAWLFIERLSLGDGKGRVGQLARLLIPATFGLTLLALWEILVLAAEISPVLLPAPSMIGVRFATATSILWADFQQTFLKAVLIGYAMGCGAGFLVALAIDRSPFLKRGLLPIGNFVSALPIIGVAPIMVMWFGFDWPSKAAVVVVMTFFPMLVNTVAGLDAADRQQRDLMRTYAAGYGQTLLKLRLPAALPFIFNALKINSTLALIGAIVAEFFGTPIVGMGFRISTEVGRMNLDMLWAEIAVAALAGAAFYGAVSAAERVVTFWHPSMRR